MGSARSPEARIIADDLERLSAQLFHLKAGVAKLQSEIEIQLEALARASCYVADAQPPPSGTRTESVDDTAAPLTSAEACAELAELERFITALEGTARKPPDKAATEPDSDCNATAPVNSHDARVDDLTRLKGITPGISEKLSQLGYKSFAAISALTARDVDRIHFELGLDVTISKANWIEQAEILRRGAETRYLLQQTGLQGARATKVSRLDELKPDDRQVFRHKLRRQAAANVDTVAQVAEFSRGLGAKMAIAASLAALLMVAHTNKVEFRSMRIVPQLQELASCGSAVVAGEPTCTRLMWLRFLLRS